MGNVVIVFSFPEPENNVEMGHLIVEAKKLFADHEGVKIHLGIKDAADTVISFFENSTQEDSNLVKHARRELELLGEEDEGFKNSIINAIKGFATYGHSGESASVAISAVHELLQFNNLTPLTDDPKEWVQTAKGVRQNARNPEAFSNDGGKTYYLLSERRQVLSDGDSYVTPIHVSASHKEKEV